MTTPPLPAVWGLVLFLAPAASGYAQAQAVIRPLPPSSGTVVVSPEGGRLCGPGPLLFVLDGDVVEGGPDGLAPEVGLLDPADILRVSVLKRADAEHRYGAAARNGVIEITTRNAPPRPAPTTAAAFPNPATGGADVTLATGLSGPVRVEVFDVLGRAALAFAAEGDALTVPTAGLAPGAYLVRVSGAGGVEVRRVTVR